MRTTDIMGHSVHWQCVLFKRVYFFATDVEGTVYMLKVNPDGTLDIL